MAGAGSIKVLEQGFGSPPVALRGPVHVKLVQGAARIPSVPDDEVVLIDHRNSNLTTRILNFS